MDRRRFIFGIAAAAVGAALPCSPRPRVGPSPLADALPVLYGIDYAQRAAVTYIVQGNHYTGEVFIITDVSLVSYYAQEFKR